MSQALLNKRTVVGRVGEGPATVAEELYRAHAQQVARWATRLGGPGTDVEDVVQEVFLTVHRTFAAFRGAAKVETWLYAITQNIVRYRRRKDRWRRWIRGSPEEYAASLPCPRAPASESLEAAQRRASVYRILDAMPEKYRTMLILFELEKLSGEQISELTGVKLATVWVRLHRARADFMKRMQAMDAQEEVP